MSKLRRHTTRKGRLSRGSLATGAALSVVGSAAVDHAGAITAYYYPPIRQEIATPAQQPQLTQGVCHDQWACDQSPPYGSNSANFWSVDLFDSQQWNTQNGSPIYATNFGLVQNTSTSGTVGVRYGGVLSGAGYGYYNGHGRLGSVPAGISAGQPVQPGQIIMKMGDTGSTNGAHLHFEIRYMSNVTSWTTNFNGYCGKHYINKLMQNAAPYPYTLAWATGWGGFNNCKGLTS